MERRRLPCIGTHRVDLIRRHVQLVVSLELDHQIVALHPTDKPLDHAPKTTHAMHVVNNERTRSELLKKRLHVPSFAGLGLAMGPATTGEVCLRQHRQLDRRGDEAPFDRRHNDLYTYGLHCLCTYVWQFADENSSGLESFVGQDVVQPIGRTLAVGGHKNAVAIHHQPTHLRHERAGVAHRGGPAHRLHHCGGRSFGGRANRPHRRHALGQQAIEREVEHGERAVVGEPGTGGLSIPRARKRADERCFLGQQVINPVPHTARLQQQNQRVPTDEIKQQVIVGTEPRKPRLHTFVDRSLANTLPLIGTPRFGAQ